MTFTLTIFYTWFDVFVFCHLVSHSVLSLEHSISTPHSVTQVIIARLLDPHRLYTAEPYKKDLHDPDNHDGVITHLEPAILECEVKWALESITTNKANGGDGIPDELFQILKDDAVKVLYSICQQIWTTQQWHRPGKGQFSFQSQRKAVPKNAQTTTQLHLSHTLTPKEI